jgi:hypothetical protein
MRRFRCAGSGGCSSRRTLASGRCYEAGTAREGVLSRGDQQGILAHASFAPANRGSGQVWEGSQRGSSQRSLILSLRTTVLLTSPQLVLFGAGSAQTPGADIFRRPYTLAGELGSPRASTSAVPIGTWVADGSCRSP